MCWLSTIVYRNEVYATVSLSVHSFAAPNIPFHFSCTGGLLGLPHGVRPKTSVQQKPICARLLEHKIKKINPMGARAYVKGAVKTDMR